MTPAAGPTEHGSFVAYSSDESADDVAVYFAPNLTDRSTESSGSSSSHDSSEGATDVGAVAGQGLGLAPPPSPAQPGELARMRSTLRSASGQQFGVTRPAPEGEPSSRAAAPGHSRGRSVDSDAGVPGLVRRLARSVSFRGSLPAGGESLREVELTRREASHGSYPIDSDGAHTERLSSRLMRVASFHRGAGSSRNAGGTKGNTIPGDLMERMAADMIEGWRGTDMAQLAEALLERRQSFRSNTAMKWDSGVAAHAPISLWAEYAPHLQDAELAAPFFTASLEHCLKSGRPSDLARQIGHAIVGLVADGGAGAAEEISVLGMAALEGVASTGRQDLVVHCLREFAASYPEMNNLVDQLRRVNIDSLVQSGLLYNALNSVAGLEMLAGEPGARTWGYYTQRLPESTAMSTVIFQERERPYLEAVQDLFKEGFSRSIGWAEHIRPAGLRSTPTMDSFDPGIRDVGEFRDLRIALERSFEQLERLEMPQVMQRVLAARRAVAEEDMPGMGVAASAELFVYEVIIPWSSMLEELQLEGISARIIASVPSYLADMAVKMRRDASEGQGAGSAGGAAAASASATVTATATATDDEVALWAGCHARFRSFIERNSRRADDASNDDDTKLA